MQQPWPVAIETVSPACVATVLWRHVGRVNLTVVIKAKVALDEGVGRLAQAEEIVVSERFDPHSRTITHDADLSPYKPRAEVTFVGHAHSRTPVPHLGVKLGVHGEGTFFEKTLQVVGDRAAPNAPPAPFQRMPISWDRAVGDGTMNPVGVDARRMPNVLNPSEPGAPAGYAPISRSWPARSRFVGRGDPRRLEGPRPEMPNDLSWGFFLGAPHDQQIERLRGNEVIVLEGLVEGRPRVRSQLPGLVATAQLYGPLSPPSGTAIELKIDTLIIDGERQCAYVIWRGTTPFANEAAASQCRVLTTVDALSEAPVAAGQQPGGPATARAPLPSTSNEVTTWGIPALGHPQGQPQSPPAPQVDARRFPAEPRTMPVGQALAGLPKLHEDQAPVYDLDDPETSSAGSTMAIDPEAAMKMIAQARGGALPFGGPAGPLGPPPAPPPPAPPPPAPPPPAPPAPPPPAPSPAPARSPAHAAAPSPGLPPRGHGTERPPPAPAPLGNRLSSPDLVVRTGPSYDVNDDDSVGSTMAITPEAAAQLLARTPGGGMPAAPPAPAHAPATTRQPARTGPPNIPPPAPPPPLPPAPSPAPPAARPLAANATPQGRHGTMEMSRVPDDDDDNETGGGTMIIQAPDAPRRR